MNLYSLIFPAESRTFPFMRWVRIILRTMHLTGMAGMTGLYFSVPLNYQYYPFAMLTFTTGFFLVALELWSNGVWLIQLRGMAVCLKLFILSFLIVTPHHGLAVMMLLIIISGVISHAPGHVRYYSILHGRSISGME